MLFMNWNVNVMTDHQLALYLLYMQCARGGEKDLVSST